MYYSIVQLIVDTHRKVTLKESKRESNKLTLTIIDSAIDDQSTTAENQIEVPVDFNGALVLSGAKDQLYLAHKLCYFLTF